MKMNEYSIFTENVIKEEELIQISEEIIVCDEIKEHHELFKDKEKIIETIIIKKGNPNLKLLHLFNDRFCKDGRVKEEGRIKFLNFNKFPDGCFLVVDTDKKKIKCYICELKHTAGDKLKLISMQFYSGYLHCKALLDAIDIQREYEVTYEYLLIGFRKESPYMEKQLIANGIVKSAPGIIPKETHEIRAYQRFKSSNMLHFSYVNDYSLKFEFTFQHICLKDKVYGPSSTKQIELRDEYTVSI